MKKLLAMGALMLMTAPIIQAQRSDTLIKNWEFSQDSTQWKM